eukprot:1076765-Pyramimonas_sp.AAC.1
MAEHCLAPFWRSVFLSALSRIGVALPRHAVAWSISGIARDFSGICTSRTTNDGPSARRGPRMSCSW